MKNLKKLNKKILVLKYFINKKAKTKNFKKKFKIPKVVSSKKSENFIKNLFFSNFLFFKKELNFFKNFPLFSDSLIILLSHFKQKYFSITDFLLILPNDEIFLKKSEYLTTTSKKYFKHKTSKRKISTFKRNLFSKPPKILLFDPIKKKFLTFFFRTSIKIFKII